MHRLILFFAIVGPLIALTACSGQKAEKPQLAPSSPPRAESKRETLVIDGKPTTITFKLFDSAKTTVPLKFTTYLPDDMISEVKSEREGDSVRFIANLGGKRDDDAFLEFVVEVQGTTEYEARAFARMAAVARGLVERPPDSPKRHQWALSEYDFEGPAPKGKRCRNDYLFATFRPLFHVRPELSGERWRANKTEGRPNPERVAVARYRTSAVRLESRRRPRARIRALPC